MTITPAERAASLRALINRANRAYYEFDAPEVSDAEYDRWMVELKALEEAHPALRTPDSPTQRVGSEPSAALAKHTHRRPMLSLANAFSAEDLEAWEDRNARITEDVRRAGYTTEVKIDGSAVSLTYEAGRFVAGATRGNGAVGELITENLKTIEDVPLLLTGGPHPRLMEIRGEVYMTHAAFTHLNREREAAGEPRYANPRNTAAGSLKLLDPRITRERRLRMYAFHIEPIEGQLGVTRHADLLQLLKRWGFQVEPHHQRHQDLAAVQAAIHDLELRLAELKFDADGIVVKVDQLALHEELGVVGEREPRWAIARKFAPDVAVTTLRKIAINVGRTGALNPYAILEPVEIGGVTVSNATLHNEDLIAEKDLREGDRVEVIRAGEVIPQVLRSIPATEGERGRPFVMPDRCPDCGTPVVRPEGEAMRYCPNGACPGRVLEGIVHFASRDAMDIRGLGYERVRQLLDAKLIADVADLYQLTAEQLTGLERFAEQSAGQLV
ncbi:MAG TPA: NAD-dependent DNA ligase LigA, partial [Gemmatimonadales bacterium]|nr:NAD-dependent DNA ligase LigA [Gemmatimonadales bacterium]